MKKIFLCCLVLSFLNAFSQDEQSLDTTWSQDPTITFSGFLDAYYVYDFNQPSTPFRQTFLYNHNRHAEFNVNLAYFKVGISHHKYRGNFAIHTGTYVADNYAAEPGILKNIFEANVGISLKSSNKLWFDAGIFSSHIGFESAISADNWTLTRSILAENSPYFLAGSKITYKPTEQLEMTGLILNGWQRIQSISGNSLPSFGSQIKYTTKKKHTLNWSTFIGTNDPDISRRMRYFSNMYGQFQLTDKLGLISGFDIGIQQRSKHSNIYDIWFSPVLIAQYAFHSKWKTAFRLEYYQDKTGILIPTNTLNGFNTHGISWNVDYSPAKPILLRLETRYIGSMDAIFEKQYSLIQSNLIIATSLALKF